MTKVDYGALSDEALMNAAANDDLRAFECLVNRHQNRVYRMALNMLNSQEDAWDVSQEIFIKVYHARRSYTEHAKFTTWLYRIMNNAVIDRIRKFKREARFRSVEDQFEEPMTPNRNAHEYMALAEVKQHMGEALTALSERQRSMVIMKYHEGFSVKEISEVFDCAAGTVKATLFQAIRNLRTHLNRYGVVNSEVSS